MVFFHEADVGRRLPSQNEQVKLVTERRLLKMLSVFVDIIVVFTFFVLSAG